MTKQLPSKKWLIVIGAVVIAAAAGIAAFLLNSGEEAYRSVMIYELDGSAVIERADIGTIDAAENLYLQSGDRVRVMEDSMMRLKLDNDKYIAAEENTVFVLTAEGDEQDSKTKIELEQGAVTSEIQNPLSSGSAYETITPNAVMAVRGTIYRVALSEDEEGNLVTRLCCFKGSVEMSPMDEQGVGEPLLVEAGNEANVNAGAGVSEVTPIDYESLPPQALKILESAGITSASAETSAQDGTDAEDVTDETVDLSDAAPADEEQDSIDSQEDAAQKEETPERRKEEQAETTVEAQAVAGSDTASAAGVDSADKAKTSADSAKTSAGQTAGGNGGSSGSQSSSPAQSTVSSPSGGQSSSQPAQGTVSSPSDSQNSSPAQSTVSDPSGGQSGSQPAQGTVSDPSGSQSGSQPGQDTADDPSIQDPEGGGGGQPHRPDKPQPPEDEEYTVTFQYDGQIFAVQKVKAGETASEPVLRPAQNGRWDFDFAQKITENVTVEWSVQHGDL